MHYHNITTDDMRNGEGLRVVLWVAGCNHYCPDCQNPVTWNPNDGLEFTMDTFVELMECLDKDYISGITFSGGDPLHPANREEISYLAGIISTCYKDKTIWLYTGYMWEEVSRLPVMNYVDVLVDGPFVKELADVKYHWAGSKNQRVIDVQKSLETGSVVLYENKEDKER